MLTHIRLERGYQRGWVSNKYREKFGVWPQGLTEVPVPPDGEVRAYVKHKAIRFAKRREAQHASAA